MRYQVGGTLTNKDPTYIERQADSELFEALLQGEFCAVLNARQMGKSSLLVRAKFRLQTEGYHCVSLDLSHIGTEDISIQQWYKSIIGELWWRFGVELNFEQWWQQQNSYSLVQKLTRFTVDVLLKQNNHTNFFVFIDEVDSILALPYSVDDFFIWIRYLYNQRSLEPEFKRINFAIFGVVSPSALIQKKHRTPFNIGCSIELSGFSFAEANSLSLGLDGCSRQASSMLRDILFWSRGQPFLTQKICKLVALEKESAGNSSIHQLVQEHIIKNWKSQDEPEHLKTISDRIVHHPYMASRLLGIYQRILTSKLPIFADQSPEQIELLLSGLVINENGILQVKNPIYEAVFDSSWVAQQLENLRPYAESLQAWLTSGQQDQTQLLHGLALQEALAWSQEKQLSDIDYRFLKVSQTQARQQVEHALINEKAERHQVESMLNMAETASQLLASARRTAKQQIQRYRLSAKTLVLISLLTAIALQLLRFTGLCQPLEWTGLDILFQLRAPESISERVSILTIDEQDIQSIGQFPFSDETLTEVLQALEREQPAVIGLDIFRDLPVQPGYKTLSEQFEQMPNLIGIEKLVGIPIAAPQALVEANQVGFADQIVDADGRVRRALLSLRQDNTIRMGLSLKLALTYLAQQDIHPQPLQENQIQLGKARLLPFQANDGGYVRADAGGYQILLNYRGTREQFLTFSLQALLQGGVKPEAIANRIVLIGTIAETVNDLAETPYSSFWSEQYQDMAGVTIHANLVGQLVSGALDGRPMLKALSSRHEWLLILVSAGFGAIAGNLRWLRQVLMGELLILLGIGGVAYWVFTLGWWLPWPVMGLASGMAAIAVFGLIYRQVQRQEREETIRFLRAVEGEQPVASKLAMEYLKQSEDINA